MKTTQKTAEDNKHVSGHFIYGIIRHLKKTYGEDETIALLNRVNLPYKQLCNKNNWLNWNDYEALLKEVLHYSNDPDILKKIAESTLRKGTLGDLWFVIFSNCISSKYTLKKAVDNIHLYNRSSEWEILELTDNKFTLKIKWKPGIKVTKRSCNHRQEIIALSPTLWSNKPAMVKEIQCQRNGHDSCIEEYLWNEKLKYVFSTLMPVSSLSTMYVTDFISNNHIYLAISLLITSLLIGYIIDIKKASNIEKNLSEGQSKILVSSIKTLEDRHNELQKTHIELNSAYDELSEVKKLEPMRFAISGVAHDYNNILTGIIGHTDITKLALEEEYNPEKIIALIDEIEKASMQAQGLTHQLLAFTKKEGTTTEVTSIKKILKENVSFFTRGSNSKCSFDIDENLHSVNIGKTQFCQLMSNLSINAIQAMPQGGNIYVSAKNTIINETNSIYFNELNSGDYVLITFKDNGPGVSEENKNRVFEANFTTKIDGLGIGLSNIYDIIKKHNGCIFIESEIDKGTTFYLYLPASISNDTYEYTKNSIIRPIFGKGRILAFDDDPIIRSILKKITHYLGYEINIVENGSEAIDLYKKSVVEENKYDVVIADLTIAGGMGGKEVIEHLLKIDPEVKIILSSGYHDASLIINYRQHGILSVIKKPYNMVDLSEVIHNTITS